MQSHFHYIINIENSCCLSDVIDSNWGNDMQMTYDNMLNLQQIWLFKKDNKK